jgi:hypothetical protein
VPQVILDGTQVMPLVRQCVPASMAEHVWMDLAQISALADAADQVVDALAGELPPRSVTNNQGNRESLIRG